MHIDQTDNKRDRLLLTITYPFVLYASVMVPIYFPQKIKVTGHNIGNCQRPGSNFMALLTVSTESALTEAGNSVLTASVFHELAANFGFSKTVRYFRGSRFSPSPLLVTN